MKEMDVAGLKTYFKISADGGVLTSTRMGAMKGKLLLRCSSMNM
eukprot:CAMPEP_0169418372 /NCGR_PEP_ID=MMETSP1017-20121227/64258_1 /TAXON_ID=342587 /ORGANISM="Karlodinium micrum, Strain CCMP2283" /LENGTH=43 /DNA_ID= /DNA_START= /DNA_END= /DNA_ORIENTATION=